MTIISMSLPPEVLEQMDLLQEDLGFSGRSELIRSAVAMLVADTKEKRKLSGVVDGVVIVIHPEKYTDDLSEIPHTFQHIIKTQIHNHLKNHKCLEIFIVHGTAEAVKRFHEAFQTSRKIELVRLFVS
jgi:CopG family nickel-responsive transcriptional regulator